MLSEELAILNRPLADDIEYYDEEPVRRWPRRVPFVIAFVAAAGVAYLFAAPRLTGLGARQAAPMARLIRLVSPALLPTADMSVSRR